MCVCVWPLNLNSLAHTGRQTDTLVKNRYINICSSSLCLLLLRLLLVTANPTDLVDFTLLHFDEEFLSHLKSHRFVPKVLHSQQVRLANVFSLSNF